MIERLIGAGVAACTLLAAVSALQQPSLPEIRAIGLRPAAETRLPRGSMAWPSGLPAGSVFLDDRLGRRLVLADSGFRPLATVMDVDGTTARRWLNPFTGALPFSADTTLDLDYDSRALLVIGPTGAIARSLSMPSPDIRPRNGVRVEGDWHGHLLYVWSLPNRPRTHADSISGAAAAPDSDALIRIDVASHRADTIAHLARAWQARTIEVTDSTGAKRLQLVLDPFPRQDAWTVMHDGSVAILRIGDYHIDWIDLDGRLTHSAALPHQWRRLTDSAKVAIVDSITRFYAASAPTSAPRGKSDQPDPARPAPLPPIPPPASELPDYAPPFNDVRALRADYEGNLWIREFPDTTVFDVANRAGHIVDRVRIPGGTSIVGFAPRSVFLMARVDTTTQVIRAIIH